DSPRLAAAANRQKKPRPAQAWSGRRLPFVTPVPRSIKGQAPEERQTSLWRKREDAPKRRPRTSIRGQLGHDAHPEGRHGKDGHPQPSARFVAGLWPRQDTFKDPGTAPG